LDANFTIKELVDLKEDLHLEGSNITTFNHFSQECQDPQLKSFMSRASTAPDSIISNAIRLHRKKTISDEKGMRNQMK